MEKRFRWRKESCWSADSDGRPGAILGYPHPAVGVDDDTEDGSLVETRLDLIPRIEITLQDRVDERLEPYWPAYGKLGILPWSSGA